MSAEDVSAVVAEATRLFQAGEKGRAEALCFRAEARLGPQADLSLILALAAEAQGDRAEARRRLEHCLALDPDHAQALYNLGVLMAEAGREERALELWRRCRDVAPGHGDARTNLVLALLKRGAWEEAEAEAEAGLRTRPDDPRLMLWRASALGHLDRRDTAEAMLVKVETLAEDRPDLWNALAMGWREIARRRREAHWLGRLAERRPDDAALHHEKAHALLASGDLRAGFEAFERRWGRTDPRPARADWSFWDGEPLEGRRLLAFDDHGFGDTLHFVRYVPLLAKRGVRVTLACREVLRRLFETLDGVEAVIPRGERRPEGFDAVLGCMSLPRVHGTSLENVPWDGPYLKTGSPAPRAPGPLRVAVVWAGDPGHPDDANRSCPFEVFSRLFAIEGIAFISLQRDPARRALAGYPEIEDGGGIPEDFATTAERMAGADLVISIDSAPAHLAGALGRPVWTLLPFLPDWRWMLGRDDTPWYPTMRLFRQTRRGDWQGVIDRVAEALRDRVREAQGR